MIEQKYTNWRDANLYKLQGLACCLMWLEWWDMRHTDDMRKQAIRGQIQPYETVTK